MTSMDELVLTRHLKRYDRDLFAARNLKGTMCVWAKQKRVEKVIDNLSAVKEGRYLVMSLTDTWGVSGKPIPWGIEVVLNRLKALDLSRNENIFKDIEREDEKVEESEKRDFSNTVESFLYDYRSEFKKSFNDVNTSNLRR